MNKIDEMAQKADMVIQYRGKDYPCTILDIPGIGNEMISVESLEDELIGDDEYVDEAAKAIDESIYFFVDDETYAELMNNEEALTAYVKEQTE